LLQTEIITFQSQALKKNFNIHVQLKVAIYGKT